MQKNLNLGKLIAGIFKKNWQENFVFDANSDTVFTYEEFFTKAKLYSLRLAELGIIGEDIVVLVMDNSLDLMILYFAGLLAGARIVPVDPFKGIESINEIFSQIECRLAITDIRSTVIPVKDFLTKKIISLNEFKKLAPQNIIAKADDLLIFNRLDYQQAYLVAFTSGSTGAPKGVMHSFENLIKSAISFSARFNFGKENVFYHNLPMTYMAGFLNQILLPFISASKIVIGERFSVANVSNFWRYPIKYSVNTFWINPTILSLLMSLDRGGEGVEYASRTPIIACVGTAPLNYQLRRKFEKKYKITLYESYGLSETLFVTTEVPNEKKVKGSVGKKLAGVEISFAADKEILLEVEWMFLGYINKNSSDALIDKKFISGDLGYIDQDDFLHVTGRKKDLIIKGGINLSPRKLEDFIGNFNFFRESVIMGLEDEVLGEKIVCFYAPDKENYSADSERKINREIVEKLGRDYKIDQFFRLAEIPKNINGKVDKLKIKEIYTEKKYDY